MPPAGSLVRRIVRLFGWPVVSGDWVTLNAPTPLPDGQIAPIGTPVHVVAIDPVDRRLIVDVPGFAGSGDSAVIGTVGRVKVPSRDVRTMWRRWPVLDP